MRKTIALLSTFMIILCLTSCGTAQLREDASAAVDTYNQAVAAYNTGIQPYNEAVGRIESANEGLLSVVNAAQDVINRGETPYDPSTLEHLKAAMADAGEAKASVPPLLEEYEMLAVPEDAKKADLESLIEQATTGTESLSAAAIPDTPSVPDYSNVSAAVTDAQRTYEDSIQSLKQITAPEDSFVMERLQRVDTITAMDAVTEDHDPNGQLNKQGGYIGCIYFTDSQVDRSQLYLEEGEDGIIDIGTDGGGAIEIFSTPEEAGVRENYLASFDGMGMMASGSHYIEGTCLIRTSNYLNGTQQKELTEKIAQALTAVD